MEFEIFRSRASTILLQVMIIGVKTGSQKMSCYKLHFKTGICRQKLRTSSFVLYYTAHCKREKPWGWTLDRFQKIYYLGLLYSPKYPFLTNLRQISDKTWRNLKKDLLRARWTKGSLQGPGGINKRKVLLNVRNGKRFVLVALRSSNYVWLSSPF